MVLPLICVHLCHACHYFSLLWHKYDKIVSKICLNGCLKICQIPRNVFWYSEISISYWFHTDFIPILTIFHIKPIPILISISNRYWYQVQLHLTDTDTTIGIGFTLYQHWWFTSMRWIGLPNTNSYIRLD